MQTCPICDSEVTESPRYPNYVCSKCYSPHRNLTVNGRICNTDTLSTLVFYYDLVNCKVLGIDCIAREAHFGGTVITIKQINN